MTKKSYFYDGDSTKTMATMPEDFNPNPNEPYDPSHKPANPIWLLLMLVVVLPGVIIGVGDLSTAESIEPATAQIKDDTASSTSYYDMPFWFSFAMFGTFFLWLIGVAVIIAQHHSLK